MSRPVRVERQRTIRASPQRVYQLLSRVEGLPRFADLWLAADVLEREGGQIVAEFRGYFAGLPVESVQRVSIRPPVRLEFRQVRGTLKALRGEYVVETDGAGSRLTARMEVEAGIPLLEERAVRMVVSSTLDRLVSKVKDAAERDLPRLVPRRAAAPAPAVAEAAMEEALPAVEAVADSAPATVVGADEETAVEATPPPETAPGGTPAEPRRGRRRRRRRHRRRPAGLPLPPGQGGSVPGPS